MHYIYWIKRKNHTDMLAEGYIGYSNNPHNRFESHKVSKTVVGNNIRKYANDVELVILEKYNKIEEALHREKELRPKKRIGWNVAIGGQIPPNNKDNEDVKKKISNSIKNLGVIPYCEKTHSKESIEKAKETRKKANRRMYHDPITGEYEFIAVGLGEKIPDGWKPGRIKKETPQKRIRGVDYVCNQKTFIVEDPTGNIFNVTNLKKWCMEHNIAYLASCKDKRWKGWKLR
jgi:predicted GIY-YIG superfamily endonuclease